MNNKIYNIFILFSAMAMLFACQPEEIDVSEITSFAQYEFEGLPETLVVEEVDETYTFDFTFNENQITDVSIEIAADESSTAVEGEDFTIDHGVDIPALRRSGSFTFTVISDYLTEGDETVILNLTSLETHGLPVTHQIEITIKDNVKSDLVLTFDWEGTFEYLGDTYTLCPNLDLDVIVVDAAGMDLGLYGAATGACPEQLIIADWDDGEYFLTSSMYENGLAGLELGVDYPITVTAFKQNEFSESFVPEDIWNSEEDDATMGNATLKPLGSVVVTGNTYVVKDANGVVVISG